MSIWEMVAGGGSMWQDYETNKRNNQAILQNAALDRQAQLDYAKNGIQWRVADLIKAGLNPRLAAGSPTHQPSPIHIGSLKSQNSNVGDYVSRGAGAIGKAMQLATLDRIELGNTLLEAQIEQVKNPHPIINQGAAPDVQKEPATVTPMDSKFNLKGVNSMYQHAVDDQGFIVKSYTQRVSEGMESDVTENVRQTARKAMGWSKLWKAQGLLYKDPSKLAYIAKQMIPYRDYIANKVLSDEGKKTHEVRLNLAQGQFRVVRKTRAGDWPEQFYDGQKFNFVSYTGHMMHRRR